MFIQGKIGYFNYSVVAAIMLDKKTSISQMLIAANILFSLAGCLGKLCFRIWIEYKPAPHVF
jgi:hypothetical protein